MMPFELLQEIRRMQNEEAREDAQAEWHNANFHKAAAIIADAEGAGVTRRAHLQQAARNEEGYLTMIEERLRPKLSAGSATHIVRACHTYIGSRMLAPLTKEEASALDGLADDDSNDFYIVDESDFIGHMRAACLADAGINSETKAQTLAEILCLKYEDWRPRNED